MSDGEQEKQVEQPKMVPESDLMAVKASHAKEVESLKNEINAHRQKADEHYQALLKAKVDLEQATSRVGELEKEVNELREIKSLKEQSDARAKELEGQLLDTYRKQLSSTYGIAEDKLQGKSLGDLKAIEEALKLTGRTAGRYDVTAGVPTTPMTPEEKIQLGFEQLGRGR